MATYDQNSLTLFHNMAPSKRKINNQSKKLIVFCYVLWNKKKNADKTSTLITPE